MNKIRIPYYEVSPELTQAIRSVGTVLEHSSLGVKFIELLYMRISQINGCEFCLKLHGRKLIEAGETEERIRQIAHWQTSALFNQREKVALAWAESLTLVCETHAPDDMFAALKEQFNDLEITEITFASASMNALNRLAIGMQRKS